MLDPTDDNNLHVVDAYVGDPKKLTQDVQKYREQGLENYNNAVKANYQNKATTDDINEYIKNRGKYQASARGVAKGYEEFAKPNLQYSDETIAEVKKDYNLASNHNVFPHSPSKANVDRQIQRLEETEVAHPNPLQDEQSWLDTLSFAFNDNKDILTHPSWFLRVFNDPQKWSSWFGDLKQGQLQKASEGFALVDAISESYRNKTATPELTGLLYLWVFLSRMQSAFPHESGFLDMAESARPYIRKALAGEFTSDPETVSFSGTRSKQALMTAIYNDAVPEHLESKAEEAIQLTKNIEEAKTKKEKENAEDAWNNLKVNPHEVAIEGRSDLDDWYLLIQKSIPKDSPGKMTTNNLNAFGLQFLRTMSVRNTENQMTRLQQLHELMANVELDGKTVRREFYKVTETDNVGFSNKILSFALLMSGRQDIFVLDRIQINQLWSGGQAQKIYDGLSQAFNGLKGLVLYEALERSTSQKITQLYEDSGRNINEASLGRYHWESWVRSSGQEVGHPTIKSLVNFSENHDNPTANVGAAEGRFN